MFSAKSTCQSVRPLSKEFIGKGEVKGYLFTQISKTDRAFIYEVNTGNQIHYEVSRKRVNHRFACISYPRANSFGIWAWTYSHLDSAMDKFNELNSCD